MAGAHRGLPVRPFLQFAVAEHDKGAPIGLRQLRADRGPDADRQAMPKRTGVRFHARDLAAIRVAVQRRKRLRMKVLSVSTGKKPRNASVE